MKAEMKRLVQLTISLMMEIPGLGMIFGGGGVED